MQVLITRELTKVYSGYVVANDNINITVNRGEVVGILGPNGAGKTTFVRQVIGVLKPTRGYIELLGHKVPDEIHRVKHFIGYMPQYPAYYHGVTVYQLVYYIARLYGMSRREAKSRTSEILKEMNLLDYANYYHNNLSVGLARVTYFCSAIVHDPEFLVLDEPTSMLDPSMRRRVISKIKEMKRQGKTVLLTTNIIRDVEELCDRVYFLLNGRVLLEGSPSEIVSRILGTIKVHVKVREKIPLEEMIRERYGDCIESIEYLEDNEIVLSVRNLVRALDFVKEIAKVANITYISISTPSLEEVYLKIYG
ncbi:MAG: ABC transporter ATP-binding protein [Thermoprotei archaeon]|nr:MAG: ABC transporter ATP-binding protein [Thermoprotei archaeon]